MRNIKLVIEYDGTNYCGWQKQSNGLSIQEVLEKTLKKILKKKVTLIGSGRTDSGVHARCQTANFITDSRLASKKLLLALNANLPSDIAVKNVEEAGPRFNARFDARNKLYRYTIFNALTPSPLEHFYSYHYRCPLNIRLMKKEAKALLGEHNFSSFRAADKRKQKVKTKINSIDIKKTGNFIYIDIIASSFLYNMARNIAGTLIEIGRDKLKEGDMERILKAKNRKLAGPTAPAKGLCLMKVNY